MKTIPGTRPLAVLLSSLLFTLPTWGDPSPAVGANEPKQGVRTPESPLLAIRHDPLKCVSTEIRPLVDAQVRPGPEMERSYVYFRAAGTEDFYYVLMAVRLEDVTAELPRPLPGTKGVEYFVQALDHKLLPKKTAEFIPPVVERRTCADERALGAGGGRSNEGLTVGLTKGGQNPVPPGFNKDDIAKVILVSGGVVLLAAALKSFGGGGAAAAGGAGAGAAGGGAGLSTLAIVGIGVGVAAGAAVAVSAASGTSPTPNHPPVFVSPPTVSPLFGAAPLAVMATANVSDQDNDPLTVTWAFGPAGATVTGRTAAFTYTTAGTFHVTATVADGKGGTASGDAGNVRVDPAGTPEFLAASTSWSGSGDLDIRLVGPSSLDVASQPGGQRVAAGCAAGNRTESVTYQGNALPAGSYTLFVKHAGTCGSPGVSVTFNYAVQSTVGSKCGGFGTVGPGTEVTACMFSFP